MPTYDYYCKECKKLFEIFHSIKDEAKTICPDCEKESLKRLISKSNFILKGGGWYSDLYSSTPKSKK